MRCENEEVELHEAADEGAKEVADEAAKEVAEEAAREAAEEAYQEAYEEAFKEVDEDAYREALSGLQLERLHFRENANGSPPSPAGYLLVCSRC